MITTYFFQAIIGLKIRLIVDERFPDRGVISFHGEPRPIACEIDFQYAYIDHLFWLFLIEKERFQQNGIPGFRLILEDQNQQLELNFPAESEEWKSFRAGAMRRLHDDKYCPLYAEQT